MFNLNITHTATEGVYNEVPQHNPLRWQIMHRHKDTLSSQAHIMKCRDFFNDLVAKHVANANFSIYRFDNSTIKFNRFGLYMLLTNIHDADQFIGNVERTLGVKLKEQLGATVKLYKQSDTSVVIRLPLVVWTKTYYASVATLAVRLCNYNQEYASWEDLFSDNNPAFTTDNAVNDSTRRYIHKNGFNLPEAVKHMWFFCGKEWNSDKSNPKEIPTILHNNGARNWCDFMKQFGVI